MSKFSEMSAARKVLYILGIVNVVLAAGQVALGALVAFAGSNAEILEALGKTTIEQLAGELNTSAEVLMLGAGVVFIILGVWSLLVGILSIRGAKRPSKLGLITVLSGISAVLTVVGLGSAAANGSLGSAVCVGILPVATFVCCLATRKEA